MNLKNLLGLLHTAVLSQEGTSSNSNSSTKNLVLLNFQTAN